MTINLMPLFEPQNSEVRSISLTAECGNYIMNEIPRSVEAFTNERSL